MALLFSREAVSKSVGGSNNAYKFKLEVYENSTNIANNTSNITLNFYGACYSSAWGFNQFSTPRASVAVDNIEKAASQVSYLSGTSYRLLCSWTGDVIHDSNGSKTINVVGGFMPNTTSYNYLPANLGIGDNITLTNIPRATTITKFNVSKISGYQGLTQVKVNWETSDTIDYLWYKVEGKTDWTGIDVPDGKSGTFNISGLNQNTSYKFSLRVRRKDSQVTSEKSGSSAISQSTYKKNTITSTINNINNKSTLNVTCDNISGANCQIRMQTSTDGTTWTNRYTISGKTKSFSNNEIASLMQYFPKNKNFKVRIIADTLTTSNTVYDSDIKVVDYSIVESNPTFQNFTIVDENNVINDSTTYIVQKLSEIKVIISSSDKMITKNYATPSHYIIEWDGKESRKDYSTNDIEIGLGTSKNSGNSTVKVTAYDSRGFSCSKSIAINIIDYKPPVQNNTAVRKNNFEATTTISIKGTYSLVNCGGINRNTIQKIEYRYAKVNENYSSNFLTLPHNINGKEYSTPDLTLTLDNLFSWKIQIKIICNLGEDSLEEIRVTEGIPILYVNSTSKNVGIGDPNTNGAAYSLKMKGNIEMPSSNLNMNTGSVNITSGSINMTNGSVNLTNGNLKVSKGNITLPSGNTILDYTVIDTW